MHASGSGVGKCYRCCFCRSSLSSISLHIYKKKSEECSMPSCLRANVNQRDKPSEGVMDLTTDDPSALCSLSCLWNHRQWEMFANTARIERQPISLVLRGDWRSLRQSVADLLPVERGNGGNSHENESARNNEYT